MTIKIINGNLFDARETFLVHQANCVTKRAKHLAADVFKRFPYANVYKGRTKPDKPGDIILRGNGVSQRFVVAMLAQYYPGRPRYAKSSLDGFVARQKYFRQALHLMGDLEGSFAFPYGIGCGAAGGDWNFYLKQIENWAQWASKQVVIYRI